MAMMFNPAHPQRKKVLIAVVAAVLIVVAGAVYYQFYFDTYDRQVSEYMDQKRLEDTRRLQELKDALAKPGITDEERYRLNANIALTAAALGLPEAQSYAKTAIEQMTKIQQSYAQDQYSMGQNKPNQRLVNIAEGTYDVTR